MSTIDVLPTPVRRSLRLAGYGINVARRRRQLTMAMMAERLGVTRQTYERVERGDPTVATGTVLMALWVLGLDWKALESHTDPAADDAGLAWHLSTLPKKVRPKRFPRPK